jgi:hypothetical protein
MKLETHLTEFKLYLRMIVVWIRVVTCKKPSDTKISLGFLGSDNGKKNESKIFILCLVFRERERG